MQTPQIQFVRFTAIALLTAMFGWNNCQGKLTSITAAGPVEASQTNAKSGPLVPPDPWES